jgi:PAS domain S-box-containing protein
VQRDITARKQFEQQLLANERELQEFSHMLQRTAEAAQAIARHQALEQTMQEVVDQARRVIGAHRAVLSLDTTAPQSDRLLRTETSLAVPLLDGRGDPIGVLELSDKEEGEFGERDEYVAIELAQLASTAIENARLFEQIRELNASLESRIAERTAELVRQGRLYRALAEQLPEVVWNTDASGHLTYLNRAWYELVGGTEADWLGNGGLTAIHPDDRQEVHANWERCRQTLSPFAGIRRLRAKDGSYHTMSYKGVPVLDETGEVAYWVGIDADITALKAIEEALRASNQELEAFSYSVSHDLRAPLGAIDGFSKALASRLEGKADEKSMHYLTRIQAGVTKMEQLIEALLGLSRVARSQLQPAPVDLSALARETLESLQMQQPERHVTVRVEDGLQVQGDPGLLRIVLENLLGNAWKFTSRATDPLIEVGRLPEGNVIFVRDNGVGFDMAYAGKLFSAFQRLHTDAEFPGTGIGLATVRRIVARHQGRVWVESQPGQGTTFFFTIPGAGGAWASAPETD